MVSIITDCVGGLNASMALKAPVKVATTANITLSGEQTIDGISVTAFKGYQISSQTEDDRVLVKNQTDAKTNGIYLVREGAWVRARDFDGSDDVTKGMMVYVKSGTVGANTYWWLTTSNDPITFGTHNITFEPAGQFWSNNVYALGSISGAQTIDLYYANVFTMTITGATTLSFTNWPSSGIYREALLIITNGGSNVTWPGGTRFHLGKQPTLSTSGTDHLLVSSEDGGTNIDVLVIGMALAA